MFWRPIVSKVLTYSEAIEMSMHQIYEVNAAIDRLIDLEKAAMNSK